MPRARVRQTRNTSVTSEALAQFNRALKLGGLFGK